MFKNTVFRVKAKSCSNKNVKNFLKFILEETKDLFLRRATNSKKKKKMSLKKKKTNTPIGR